MSESPYIIRSGSLSGRSIETVDLQVLQQFVSRHVQPDELYEASVAELKRRGETPAQHEKANPSAFTVPEPRRGGLRIPDSLAEISQGATVAPSGERGTAPPPAPAGQGHSQVAEGRRTSSAGESIPMPCGHSTDDLGWLTSDISACMACQRLEEALAALGTLKGEKRYRLLHALEREARSLGWPHVASKNWSALIHGERSEGP